MGYVVRGPLGGLTWHHLQYVTGLAALGHSVWFVEDSDDYPACYDPSIDATGTDPSYGLRYAAQVFSRVGMGDAWAYHDAHARRWMGPRAGNMVEICRRADLLLNVSGVNPLRPWVADIPVRALIDTDPVFTQIRHLQDPAAMARAQGHTAFLTFGENYGKPGCTIPDDGLPWVGTRQPVVLDAWPVEAPPAQGRLTTVMQWDSYPAREHRGVRYGMKSASFAPYADLPEIVGARFEIALGGATAPRTDLAAKGWTLRNPLDVSRDPWTYQAYLRQSHAEFSVAKHGYVASRSGWFSERSAAYLACGRPVVVQDTGFTRWLRADAGVLPFDDREGACRAIADLDARYAKHCRAAREIAAECFAAAKVLPALIEAVCR